jgi:hypothetical protein
MVFIGRDIPERWVRALLDLLDAEVTDEIRRAHLRRSALSEICSIATRTP